MRPIIENTNIMGFAGTAATPGTITGTGVDWSPTYESYGRLTCNVGEITGAAGSVVFHVQASATDANYTTIGSIAVGGPAQGSQIVAVDITPALLSQRWVRALSTVAAGSVCIAAQFVAKPRTPTV